MKGICLLCLTICSLLLFSVKLFSQQVERSPERLDSSGRRSYSDSPQSRFVGRSDPNFHRKEHIYIGGLISLGEAYLEEKKLTETKSIIDSVRSQIGFYQMYELNSPLYLLLSRYYAQTGDIQSSMLYMDSLEIQNKEYQKKYEISPIRKIEKQLTLENLRKEMHRNLFLLLSLLFIVAVISYLLYFRLIKRENFLFYKWVVEGDNQKKELTETNRRFFAAPPQDVVPEKPVVKESNGKGLMQRLEELMQTELLFTNPSISRKSLADRLNTNENYLANAIRNCCNGKTFSDYINCLRLEYAHHLLIDKPELSIKEITDICGFPSYKYFHKLFHEKYGMSPSKYKGVERK